MLFTVRQLIEDRPAPTVIGPEQTGLEALSLMIQHKYSQLPVVDEASRLIGLITSDSLLQAVNSLGVLPQDLRVNDARITPRTASVESDIFDLIDDLKAAAAVLIVDAAQQLVGIVTDYDAMDFLRRRAEDMMLVEDIETSLKDHIRAAFSRNGQVDEHKLATAIAEVTDSQKERSEQFRKALAYYLSLSGDGGSGKPVASRVEQVLAKYYADQSAGKSLDDLTMSQYVDVLLHKSIQTHIEHVFPVGAKAVRTLFNSVRPIRNALAHFRGGITPQQREQLRFCAEWLARATASLNATTGQAAASAQGTPEFAGDASCSAQNEIATPQPPVSSDHAPSDDAAAEPHVQESEPPKITAAGAMRVADYGRLTERLRAQPSDCTVVSMAFSEIEWLIGGSLPDAARQHRSWWSNEAATSSYAKAWIDAGWHVSADMIDQIATFTRERT